MTVTLMAHHFLQEVVVLKSRSIKAKKKEKYQDLSLRKRTIVFKILMTEI